MQILSLIIGVLSIIGMFVAFIPLLGWMNWFNIPFAVVGLVLGIIGVVLARRGRGVGIAGILLCLAAILIGAIRLSIGGGII